MLQSDLQSCVVTRIPSHQRGLTGRADPAQSQVSSPAQLLHSRPIPIPGEMTQASPLAVADSRTRNLPAALGCPALRHSFHPAAPHHWEGAGLWAFSRQ